MNVQIEPGWKKVLHTEFEASYFGDIKSFLVNEYSTGKTVYPPAKLIFNAFNLCPINAVKVVILGQDPYHGAGQAHGLCFSVPQGIKPPPSLVNIFKELHDDIGCALPQQGDLSTWTTQGVLLLNSILTVRANEAASHKLAGWETFTNAVIKTLSDTKVNLVFILWGRFAQNKAVLINTDKHLVLKAAHPSPLSVYNGFYGSKPFSKTNAYLTGHHINPINWTLT